MDDKMFEDLGSLFNQNDDCEFIMSHRDILDKYIILDMTKSQDLDDF